MKKERIHLGKEIYNRKNRKIQTGVNKRNKIETKRKYIRTGVFDIRQNNENNISIHNSIKDRNVSQWDRNVSPKDRNVSTLDKNFLQSSTARNLISTSKLEISKNSIVIEIGAGEGQLTFPISQIAKTVYAVEIDKKLAEKLKKKVNEKQIGNIKVQEDDILKIKVTEKVYTLIGNIPFSITSKIFDRFTLSERILPQHMYFLMELPAYKKYSSTRCLAGILTGTYFESNILRNVNRKFFHPVPNSSICFADFSLRKNPLIPYNLKQDYIYFVKYFYNAGNRTIGNTLNKLLTIKESTIYLHEFHKIHKRKIENLKLTDMNIEDWVMFFKFFYPICFKKIYRNRK